MSRRMMGYMAAAALATTLAVAPKLIRGQTMVEPPNRGAAASGNANSGACGLIAGRCGAGIQCKGILKERTTARELLSSWMSVTSIMIETGEWQFDETPTARAREEPEGDGPTGGQGRGTLTGMVSLREWVQGRAGLLEAVIRLRLQDDISLESTSQDDMQAAILMTEGTYQLRIKLMPGQDILVGPAGQQPVHADYAWGRHTTFSALGDALNDPVVCESQ